MYDKYKEKFEKWRALYCQMHKSYILNMKFTKEEKEALEENFDRFCPKQFEIQMQVFSVQQKLNGIVDLMN